MQKTKAVIALQGSQHWTVVSKQRKFISAVEIQPWILSWILKVHGKILSTPYFRTSVRCFFSLAQGKRGDESSHRSTPAIQKVQVKSERASHTAQLNHHIQRHCYTLPSLAGLGEMSFLLSHRQQLISGRSLWKEDLCPFQELSTSSHTGDRYRRYAFFIFITSI